MTAKRYGLYTHRKSLFHGLHPLTKLLSAAVLLVCPLFLPDLLGSALYLAGCLLLVGAARAWRSLRTLLPIVVMMAAVTIVVWPLFWRSGEELFSFFGLPVTRQGVVHGVTMACRLVSLVLVGVVFLTVTRVEEFTEALSLLGLPFVVTFTLMLSFRLAPTFISTVGTIRDAQMARGHSIDQGNLLKRAAKHVPLIIPVILHAVRATDVLSMALESRGFGKKATRTSITLRRAANTWRDALAYAATGLVMAGAIAWRCLA